MEMFVPTVLTHLIYSVLCLGVIAATLIGIETVQKIRRRYGRIQFRMRYAMPYMRRLAGQINSLTN